MNEATRRDDKGRIMQEQWRVTEKIVTPARGRRPRQERTVGHLDWTEDQDMARLRCAQVRANSEDDATIEIEHRWSLHPAHVTLETHKREIESNLAAIERHCLGTARDLREAADEIERRAKGIKELPRVPGALLDGPQWAIETVYRSLTQPANSARVDILVQSARTLDALRAVLPYLEAEVARIEAEAQRLEAEQTR